MQLRDGLVDAASLRTALAGLTRGLVLFGHLSHPPALSAPDRIRRARSIGASGAALDHPDSAIRAGFNLYDQKDGGLASAEAYVIEPGTHVLRRTIIPERPGCV